MVENGGEEGGNVKATRAFVHLTAERGQRTYIKLKEIREMIAGSGGLCPWLQENGADILEKKSEYREFRIKKTFYEVMLSGFLNDATTDSDRG